MTQVAYAGQFSDTETYTHTRIAMIFGVRKRWVMERMINPPDGQGVRHYKVGEVYFVSGADIRNWVERNGGFYNEDKEPD